MLTVGNLLQDRYRIVRRLGGGGMGTVYLAEDTRLSEHFCAIKEMSPELEKRSAREAGWAVDIFRQEANMLAKLRHEGLTAVTDFFSEGSNWYLVMDFVEGNSLARRLKEAANNRLPMSEALEITRQLCIVLEFLHKQTPPVIFRDLKPGNVMLTPQGQVKLIDFGIARFFKTGQTRDTIAFLTPGYAAPEQHGEGQTDERSDIYSLGILLHRMLTGYSPATTPFHQPEASELNPDVPSHINQTIRRATQMNPTQRFQSVPALCQALSSPSRRSWSRIAARLLILVVAVVAGAVILFALGNDGTPSTPESALTQLPLVIEITSTPLPGVATVTPAPATPSPVPPTAATDLKVVFSRGGVGCADIVVHNINTNSETTYRWAGNNEEPSWSPDGRWFVASSASCNSNQRSLIAFNTDTGEQVVVLDDGATNIDPDWGNDDRIYFVSGSKTEGGNMYSILPDGSDHRSLGESGRQPTLSPNGRQLAYMQISGNSWRIWVADVGSDGRLENAQQLTFPSTPGGVHARMPNWTSDSARVVFNITAGDFNSVALGTVEVATNSATASTTSSSSGSLFARPSCGQNSLCVVNETEGGLWFLRESNGNYTVDAPITDNADDWGPDIYP